MIALLREVSPRLDRCELTHLTRTRISVPLARKQHAAFVKVLKELGVEPEFVPALPDQPDSVFVEDTALLLPEVALVARLGAASRSREVDGVVPVLAQYRPVQRIGGSGTLDGGDVLRIGHTLFVGQSARTNEDGIGMLKEIVEPFGYEVRTVEIRDCAHLKTACTFVPPRFLIVNPTWVQPALFDNLTIIPVDETEPFAANTLTIRGTTLVSGSCPKTEKRLREAGITTLSVDVSEFEKAEGGLTCLCLVLEPRRINDSMGAAGLRTIHVPGALAPAGHASQAIVHGGLVYVSPQLPFDPAPGHSRRIPVEEQAELALRNLVSILVAAGSALPRVLHTTVHVADPKLVERMEPAYARAFGGHRPTRAVITNSSLPPGVLVQIEATAALIEESV